MSNLQVSFISSITEIEKSQYQSLLNTGNPFIQYEFLKALELSGAVSEQSGWKICHLVIKQQLNLVAFVPLYLKSHSYGEYVFDFEWAKAYQESGLQYYPKLLTSIPFTPVSGERILVHPDYKIENLLTIILSAIESLAKSNNASSWHLLFPNSQLNQQLCKLGLLHKTGVQFHWFNRNYRNFDDFLQTMNSKRRKDIRRERKQVAQQGIQLNVVEGKDINRSLWKKFHLFYQLTYVKRSGHRGYLPEQFFTIVGNSMANNILLVTATADEQIIAASLFFKDQNTLYGRYWGAQREYNFLHFESCYYQGIEYCINHQVDKFDAGAQGEHKLQRGFEPVVTYSNHWVENDTFNKAISHHLQQERRYCKLYFQSANENSPYKMG